MGVAGAGKTTMLLTANDAFERSGCLVIGTATSGQAARNLGHEAEIAQSRTLASLIWRLDHGQMVLSEKTVVILDEVGMTDDAGLARLAAYSELAGAKLVLAGDHRQLGPVGPGGALGALVQRHPNAVHYLGENRRQRDPGEREALEALRDGEVGEAISWYVGQGRVHGVPTRDDALQAAVEAWAADVAAGHGTGLYAWRRANVAELNRRARACMEASGRLAGPELTCPGGAAYRAGDRVVTLAPCPGGSLVTSERATVERVDTASGSLVLRTDDGRQARLSGEETGADRLALGYATTVHRSQGSTVTRAHLFADGGGRELAYVAMSRARECTHAWLVAADPGQAGDDLRANWSAERTPTWAIDTALPSLAAATREVMAATPRSDLARIVALALAETKAGSDALKDLQPRQRAEELAAARTALSRAEQDLADLQVGTGPYRRTEAGRAVSDLASAQASLIAAKWAAEHSPRWRGRRAAAKESAVVAGQLADAERRWRTHVAPELARLEAQVFEGQGAVGSLLAHQEAQAARWWPLAERGHALKRDVQRFAVGLTSYREGLDGKRTSAPKHVGGPLYPAPTATTAIDHDYGPGM